MAFEPTKVGLIRPGKYIIEPDSKKICQVVSVDKSKPGKHGAAKARMVLIGLFDGKKSELVSGVDKRVNVPIIEKKSATVTNVLETTVMLMDSEDFSEFEVMLPTDEDLRNKLLDLFKAGKGVSVEVWNVMNQKKIDKVNEEE
ncbi:MAG: Translation initiation factor 5A [Candidatus Heimdallarchaeota archaeon LC_3]|nr:MAG: Translation initiation factor 5A [Candidatus Heimdallarchaeota archaeon LC_3]